MLKPAAVFEPCTIENGKTKISNTIDIALKALDKEVSEAESIKNKARALQERAKEGLSAALRVRKIA